MRVDLVRETFPSLIKSVIYIFVIVFVIVYIKNDMTIKERDIHP